MKIQMQKGRTLSWLDYVDALQVRFSEGRFGDPILEMKNLRQDILFPDYQWGFNVFLHRIQLIENVSERSVVIQFI